MTTDPAALPGGAAIDELSYEECREALGAVVTALEQGNTSLEQALALWERGEALAKRCQDWLDGARERLVAATATQDDDQPS